MHGLDLLEALLDTRLALVGDEHLRAREGSVVGPQGEHAVGALVAGNGLVIERPLDVEASLGDLAVGGVGPGAPAPGLLVEVLLDFGA